MKKRYRKTSLVFIATLLSALVLLGSTALILLNNLMQRPSEEESISLVTDSVSKEYIPTDEEAQTVLFILDAGKKPNEKLFLLTRFIPKEKTLWLVPVAGDTYAQLNTKKSTVCEFYRTGGALSAVSAVESAFNIPVERYAKLDRQAFRELADMFGGVIFNVPYDMECRNEDTGEQTSLTAGVQTLDGNMLRQMLTFPELKDEDLRIKLVAGAVSAMINGGLNSRLYDNAEYFFNSFVNSAETNITAYDFDLRSEALVYVMKSDEPAQFKIPAGKYDGEKRFVIDKIFKENLAEAFGVEALIK